MKLNPEERNYLSMIIWKCKSKLIAGDTYSVVSFCIFPKRLQIYIQNENSSRFTRLNISKGDWVWLENVLCTYRIIYACGGRRVKKELLSRERYNTVVIDKLSE